MKGEKLNLKIFVGKKIVVAGVFLIITTVVCGLCIVHCHHHVY